MAATWTPTAAWMAMTPRARVTYFVGMCIARVVDPLSCVARIAEVSGVTVEEATAIIADPATRRALETEALARLSDEREARRTETPAQRQARRERDHEED